MTPLEVKASTQTSMFRVSRILGTTLFVLFVSAISLANPIRLTISNGGSTQTFNGTGYVGYGTSGNMLPTGNPKHPLFKVAILGLTTPNSSPDLLDLATVDFKQTSFCTGHCALNIDLVATGFTQPYQSLITSLGGYTLNSSSASFSLSAFLDPLHGAPILLESCSGKGGGAAYCSQTNPFSYTGIYGLELKLVIDANGGSGTFTDSSISGAVPEPGGLVLLGTGLVGLAATLRKRFKYPKP